jgi:hypothetical protein
MPAVLPISPCNSAPPLRTEPNILKYIFVLGPRPAIRKMDRAKGLRLNFIYIAPDTTGPDPNDEFLPPPPPSGRPLWCSAAGD